MINPMTFNDRFGPGTLTGQQLAAKTTPRIPTLQHFAQGCGVESRRALPRSGYTL